MVRWLPSFVICHLSSISRYAAGSGASRVLWAKTKSTSGTALRPRTPVFGGGALAFDPFRHGFSWTVSKAGGSVGSPFSRIWVEVPGGGRAA